MYVYAGANGLRLEGERSGRRLVSLIIKQLGLSDVDTELLITGLRLMGGGNQIYDQDSPEGLRIQELAKH